MLYREADEKLAGVTSFGCDLCLRGSLLDGPASESGEESLQTVRPQRKEAPKSKQENKGFSRPQIDDSGDESMISKSCRWAVNQYHIIIPAVWEPHIRHLSPASAAVCERDVFTR